jgi:hypothetical protein
MPVQVLVIPREGVERLVGDLDSLSDLIAGDPERGL